MEFKIIENTLERIKVSVKIAKRRLAIDPNTHVDTQDVTDFLGREGIEFTNCVGETVLDNYSDNPRLEGEWTFNKRVPKVKRKIDVAIAKENTSTTTNTTKKRRRKTSTPQENQFLGTENME
jgi:hypothetical protein